MTTSTGLTETTVGCLLHRYEEERDQGVSVPVGLPGANMKVYLLDGAGVGGEGMVGDIDRRRGSGAGVSEWGGADGGAVRGERVWRGRADIGPGIRDGGWGAESWSIWGEETSR